MKPSALFYLTTAFVGLFLTSCYKVGIDYTSPTLKSPDAWSQGVVRDLKGVNGGIENWWKKFNDPTLNQLISDAREANPTLEIAYEQIIIDTKTIDQITGHERGKMMNYLRITRLSIGLIINFKKPRLEWERIVLTPGS